MNLALFEISHIQSLGQSLRSTSNHLNLQTLNIRIRNHKCTYIELTVRAHRYTNLVASSILKSRIDSDEVRRILSECYSFSLVIIRKVTGNRSISFYDDRSDKYFIIKVALLYTIYGNIKRSSKWLELQIYFSIILSARHETRYLCNHECTVHIGSSLKITYISFTIHYFCCRRSLENRHGSTKRTSAAAVSFNILSRIHSVEIVCIGIAQLNSYFTILSSCSRILVFHTINSVCSLLASCHGLRRININLV